MLGSGESHLSNSWLYNENDVKSNEKKLKSVKVWHNFFCQHCIHICASFILLQLIHFLKNLLFFLKVSIEGNIGSGKTTLLEYFKKHSHVEVNSLNYHCSKLLLKFIRSKIHK